MLTPEPDDNFSFAFRFSKSKILSRISSWCNPTRIGLRDFIIHLVTINKYDTL